MGTVSEAVAQRQAEVTPAQVIAQTVNRYKPVIARLLTETGMNEETFAAQLANAYRANPELWNCSPGSVLAASLRCAQLGLPPNDVRNLAWIIPYRGEATFQIGYGGVMELAMRAVPGLKFDGRPVYPNDEFDVDFGLAQSLHHQPHYARRMDRGGDPFLWYVRARYPDGTELIHALDRAGVEYHRAFSRQPDGLMWSRSYDAAALKSVVLDMRRWLPSTVQLAAALASDEAVLDPTQIDSLEAAATDRQTPEPAAGPEPAPRPRRGARKAPASLPPDAGAEQSAGGPDEDAQPPADAPTAEDQADEEWVRRAEGLP